jgi:hypothetical protein
VVQGEGADDYEQVDAEIADFVANHNQPLVQNSARARFIQEQVGLIAAIANS